MRTSMQVIGKSCQRQFATRRRRLLLAVLALLFGLVLIELTLIDRVLSAGGDLDSTFNASVTGSLGTVRAVAVQPDGRILVGGEFSLVNGENRPGVARLNMDGSIDASFNAGGEGIGGGSVSAVAVQPDGRILVGGNFTGYNGASHLRLIRLNPDGSLDASFNNNEGSPFGNGPFSGGATATVTAIVVQPDGRILLGVNSLELRRILRLNADGSVDTAFNTASGTGAISTVNAIALQADGTIIIGGDFTSYNGTARNRIARLNADGRLDTTFSIGTGANATVSAVALQTDGRILFGGSFTNVNGTARSFMARLNVDGTLDAGFNPSADSSVTAIMIQPDSRIIVGGNFTFISSTTRNRIARLNADGSNDASFNPGTGTGTGSSSVVFAITLQADNQILIGGSFSIYNGALRKGAARLNSDGSLDSSFGAIAGNPGQVSGLVVQPDNRIIIRSNTVAGAFSPGDNFLAANGVYRNALARLNADGTTDTSFNPGTGPNQGINGVAVQTDGRIIIVGGFTNFNGVTQNRIARLNSDGSLDATFTIGTGANSIVRAVALQPDGRILIAGSFSSFNGISRGTVARLNADGTVDLSFTSGSGTIGSINAIAVQADGRILIGGGFPTTAVRNIQRLNADGSLDSSFSVSPQTGIVNAIVLQPDNRILVGGDFTIFNSASRNRIVRLNTDGSLDASFDIGTGANLAVNSVVLQANGRIVIGGGFTNYNGIVRRNIAQLNADGSLDASFDSGAGASDIRTIGLQTDGRIVIGGNFTSYDGTFRAGLARLETGAIVTWTGAVSSDWHNAGNWSPARIPLVDDEVIIPLGALPNQPVVSNADATALALTVAAGQTLSVTAGRALNLSGLRNFGTIAGTGTMNLTAPFTINDGIISISNVVVSGMNLRLSGAGSFSNNMLTTQSGGSVTLASNHQLSSVTDAGSGGLGTGGFTLSLSGAGTPYITSNPNFQFTTGTVVYNGAQPQTTTGFSFNGLTINNLAGVTLSPTVGTTFVTNLTLLNGNVLTGANSLRLGFGVSGTVNRISGHVIGRVRQDFGAPLNFTFPVGTANGYSPVTVNVTAFTFSFVGITVETFQTNQPMSNPATSLRRYWSLTAEGDPTANLTFNYPQTDVMGDESRYRIVRVNGSTVTPFPNNCPSPCVNTANNTATINGVTEFSDWTLNEGAIVANQPPTVTNPGDRNNAEGDNVSLQITATDPNGDPLAYSASNLPPGLSIDSNTGLITGTLAFTSAGTYTVGVSVSDGSLTTSESFIWTVSNTNRPPNISNPGNQTHAENDAVSLQINASDPDGDALAFSATGLPPGLSINSTTGVISGTLPYTAAGSYNVTVTVTDGSISSSANFNWLINNTNRAPTADSLNAATDEDMARAITLSGADADGDAITFTVTGNPSNGTLSGTGANLTYTPNANYTGADSFAYVANDGSLNSAPATVSISVAPVNDAPAITNPGNQTNAENDTVSLQVNASDAENSSLIYGASGLPPGVSIDQNTGSISGTITYEAAGIHNVTLSVFDGSLTSNTSFTWTVSNVNRAPAANNGSVLTAEDNAVAITLVALDPDGEAVNYMIATNPANGTLSGSGANLTYTPNANFNGTDSFTFRASDSSLDSNAATVSITVTPVNDAPVLAAVGNRSLTQGSTLSFSLSATDVDGDTLVFSANNLPSGAALNTATGAFSWTPTSAQAGAYTVTFIVTDAGSASDSETLIINVHVQNQPPVARAMNITVSANSSCLATITPQQVDNGSSDPDSGDTITLSLDNTGPFSPGGPYQVTLTATDSHNASSSAQATVTVVDTTPPAVTTPVSINAYTDINCQAAIPNVLPQVTASDSCGPVTLSQSPAAGTLVGVGSHTITVTATDGSTNSRSATTTFTVIAVPSFTVSVNPTTVRRGGRVILSAGVRNCASSRQTVTLKVRLTSPTINNLMLTLPVTLQAGQAGSLGIPLTIPSSTPTGLYSLTLEVYVQGTIVGMSTAQLTVTP